jgi:hypothetical protein
VQRGEGHVAEIVAEVTQRFLDRRRDVVRYAARHE